MINRVLVSVALLFALVGSAMAQNSNGQFFGRPHSSPHTFCGVIRQHGVVRNVTKGEDDYRRIELVVPCDWTDDQALAAWRHRPDPVWGCGGFNLSNPGQPNCIDETVRDAGEAMGKCGPYGCVQGDGR